MLLQHGLSNVSTGASFVAIEPTVNEKGSPTSASTSDIMLVQETMQVLGLYAGEIDGLPGSKTMRAVRTYKKRNNLPPNNALTAEFIAHLRDAL